MNYLLVKKFLKQGYVISNLNKNELIHLNKIKKKIVKILKNSFKKKNKKNDFFENFHQHIDKKNLNKLRLKVFSKINKYNFNKHYYKIFSRFIEPLVGTENVIQKKINISVQLPNDDSSLLPVHSDTWAGDSPFEIVVWVPLVDCKKTQSMFILPNSSGIAKKFSSLNFYDNDEIMKKIEKQIKFLEIKYGQVLIFSQNLPHGNVVNKENRTRWSFNARVKSLMSPYSKKGLLDFFDIIDIKPATKFGLDYNEPKFK